MCVSGAVVAIPVAAEWTQWANCLTWQSVFLGNLNQDLFQKFFSIVDMKIFEVSLAQTKPVQAPWTVACQSLWYRGVLYYLLFCSCLIYNDLQLDMMTSQAFSLCNYMVKFFWSKEVRLGCLSKPWYNCLFFPWLPYTYILLLLFCFVFLFCFSSCWSVVFVLSWRMQLRFKKKYWFLNDVCGSFLHFECWNIFMWTTSFFSAQHRNMICHDIDIWKVILKLWNIHFKVSECHTHSSLKTVCWLWFGSELYWSKSLQTRRVGSLCFLRGQRQCWRWWRTLSDLIINNNRIQRLYSRFFTISSLRREPSPTRTLKWPGPNCVQITYDKLSADHVQHVVLRAMWYEGTAQLLSLTELKLHLFEIYFGWTIKPMKGSKAMLTMMENPVIDLPCTSVVVKSF